MVLAWRQSWSRDSYDGALRTDSLDGARITFKAAAIAHFKMQRPIARRRFTRLHALAAAVTQRFIDGVFVIIVIRILFVDLADYPPFQRVLWAGFPSGEPLFIRLACDIEVRGAQLAITALCKPVHRFHRRMAQNTGSAAQITGHTL